MKIDQEAEEMPQTRIPTEEDFAPLSPHLTTSLVFPSPRESTTAILLLFHGLGDSEAPFAGFARNLALPGVLAISVRGTSPLPPALLGEPLGSGPARHFHWGDDLTLGGEEDLEPDPGFERAVGLVLRRLVRETLVERCGWETSDILLFGFGQGGSLALGLASRLKVGLDGAVSGGERVKEIEDDGGEDGGKAGGAIGGDRASGKAFKGVVSVGGPLLASTIPRGAACGKSRTPVLVCHGSESEAVDHMAVEVLKQEFVDVRVSKWKRPDDGMPRSREEVLPMMQFFAERLRSGW